MREISIRMRSPGASHTGGLRNAPTPAGVPVAMTSPGSSVTNRLMYSINRSTEKIIWDVCPCCMSSPFT
jgi:hypothetical protein